MILVIYIYTYTHVIQCTHTYTDPKWMVSDPMTGNVAHSYLTTLAGLHPSPGFRSMTEMQSY